MNEVSAGIHRMLKETGYQYDFIDFEMDLSKYKIVILPDIIRLNADEADKINSYLKEGGKLVASHLSLSLIHISISFTKASVLSGVNTP